MGQISKEAFKKLTLLFLISRFKDGIYTNYRFQKVLYFAIKDTKLHPFTYQHTQHGEYSYNASKVQDSLVWINRIEETRLDDTECEGSKLTIHQNDVNHHFVDIFTRISRSLASSIEKSVQENGYLKSSDLVRKAEADALLQETPPGGILFTENLPDMIDVPLDDDECEEIELSLNDNFNIAMKKCAEVIETTKFNFGKVSKIGSIL